MFIHQYVIYTHFSKSLNLRHKGEKSLLPLVRTFLLGYFQECPIPEARASLHTASTGNGRIDFIVADVAVEFAVRIPSAPKRHLSAKTNETEVQKLLKYKGKPLLVLFDFSKYPYESEELEEFREPPPLGKGNHKKYPFTLAYFYLAKRKPKEVAVITKQIKAN